MPKKKQIDVDEWARVYEGLAHAFRLTILDVLRKEKRVSMADLRRAVSERYMDIETRNLQFHAFKMQMGGLVRIEREGSRDFVVLVRDVLSELEDA